MLNQLFSTLQSEIGDNIDLVNDISDSDEPVLFHSKKVINRLILDSSVSINPLMYKRNTTNVSME